MVVVHHLDRTYHYRGRTIGISELRLDNLFEANNAYCLNSPTYTLFTLQGTRRCLDTSETGTSMLSCYRLFYLSLQDIPEGVLPRQQPLFTFVRTYIKFSHLLADADIIHVGLTFLFYPYPLVAFQRYQNTQKIT